MHVVFLLKQRMCGLEVQTWFIVACLFGLRGFAGLIWYSVFYIIKTNAKINLKKMLKCFKN